MFWLLDREENKLVFKLTYRGLISSFLLAVTFNSCYASNDPANSIHKPTSVFQQSLIEQQRECVNSGDCEKRDSEDSVKQPVQYSGNWTIWGHLFHSRMRDSRNDGEGNLETDKVRTTVESIVIQRLLNAAWQAGVILMHQEAKLETGHTFNSQASDIFSKVDIKGNGLFPFVRYFTPIGLQLYAAIGYARSSVKFRDFVRPIMDFPPYKTHESTVIAQVAATLPYRLTVKDLLTFRIGYVFRKSRLGDYVAPGPLYVPKQYTRNGILDMSITYARVLHEKLRGYVGAQISQDVYRSRTFLDIWPREDYRQRFGIGGRVGLMAAITKNVSALVEYSHKRWTSSLKIDTYFAGIRIRFGQQESKN